MRLRQTMSMALIWVSVSMGLFAESGWPQGVNCACLSPGLAMQSDGIKTMFTGTRYPVSVRVISRAELSPYRGQIFSILKKIGFNEIYIKDVLAYAIDESPSATFVLLLRQNSVVGISVVCDGVDSDEALLVAIGVSPDLQLRGLGKVLWDETVKHILRQGYSSVYAEIDQTKKNNALIRWMREMENRGELTAVHKGIAYDFAPNIIYYRVEFTRAAGVTVHLRFPENIPASVPLRFNVPSQTLLQSAV